MKDTLFHINWGDGDTTFVIAPDEKTAKERMGDGEDMVNNMVRLDHLYQMIYKAGYEKAEKEGIVRLNGCKDGCALSIKDSRLEGRRDVVEWIKKNRETPLGKDPYGYYVWEVALDVQCKEWGL